MKNVLLLVHDDAGQEARLQAALDLTRALDGHLSCVDVSLLPAVAGDYYAATAEVMLLEDERVREHANRGRLEARLAREDVPWDWIDVTGNFVDAVLDCATLADIIVLNRKLDGFPFPDMRDVASSILTHARTPILAVPDTQKRFCLGRVLVAWDGRPSCAATLRASVPLLRLANAVEIFTVRDGAKQVNPEQAGAYLSRHGIHAAVRAIDDGLHAVDEHINTESEAFKADYVVMGAYSRGRLMETFGGVTKRMLGRAKLPLLLGH
jgi:nucleotide-binding universal stress UspA family protein